MRITGGKYRSRRIKTPPGVIRPAMDRMRESMFSIHTSYYGNLENFSFLDLFSGSGIVALEAASRGCDYIVLVEKDAKKRSTIIENIAIADVKKQLYMTSVENFIRKESDNSIQYDLIHLDPPFPMPNKFSYIQMLLENNFLKDDGTLTIHYPKEDTVVEVIENFSCEDIRSYGRSQLAFYRRTTSPA